MTENEILIKSWKDYNPNIVKINEEVINNFNIDLNLVNSISNTETNFPEISKSEIVRYIISRNSINYQFWDMQDGIYSRYTNNGSVGALAMSDGFLNFYNELKLNNFNTQLIDSDLIIKHFGTIPDIDGRIEILKEVFDNNNYKKVEDIINTAIQEKLFNTKTSLKISEVLPKSYKDDYCKKIQLSLYEISDELKDLIIKCDITVAADYQLPKVLEGLGVLSYNYELKSKIDNKELINEDSPEELAIRAATILACDLIKDKLNISTQLLDRYLWLIRNDFKQNNFHLTKTKKY